MSTLFNKLTAKRTALVSDLEDAAALEDDVDLVFVVRLLSVRLGGDEHVDADLEPRRAVDDVVAAATLDQCAPRPVHIERVGGG